MSIVEFIEARLREREQIARAAVIPTHDGPDAYKPHPELAAWQYEPGREVEYVSTPEMQRHEYADTYRVTCDSEGLSPAVDESVGPHIALNDPAYVLDDIAAKRRIVALHRVREGTGGDWDTDPPAMCSECNHELHPCQTLRLLGAPFASHPDCDPSWKPSSA